VFGSMAAGALTGALFKSTGGRFPISPLLVHTNSMFALLFTAGVKPALATATVVSAFAGVWSWIKTRV
jgi:hypothetical protein